jgi:hypothetical protein
MLRTEDNLTELLKNAFESSDLYRVYERALLACFCPLREHTPDEGKIREFAARNGWQVKVHTPEDSGVVADFRKG